MRQFFLIASLLWSLTGVFAQTTTSDIKEKKWKFGIYTGLNYQSLKAKNGPNFGFTTESGLGLFCGMLSEYKASQTVSILPRFGFSFHSAKLSYGSEIEYFMPVTLDISTYVSFAFSKNKNNPYLFFGPSYSLPIKTKSSIDIKKYLSIDVGIGLNQVFNKLIFSPELRYSRALTNVSDSALVDHLVPHTFSLLLGFKG
jgi:Outer membrane protein beta-barrel domain